MSDSGMRPGGFGGEPEAGGKGLGFRLRRTLRRALQAAQFGVLYLWHSATEPPRVLAFSRMTNARLLRAFGAKVGKDVRLQPPLHFNLGPVGYANLTIGDGVVLNGNNYIDLNEPVTIGDGASLGPGVTVMTHNRFNFNPFLEKRLARLCGRMPVTIGPGAGIKAHALILHGVTIGAEAVVAGGAIVVKDVPPRTWVTGSPAVVKMTLD